MPRKFPRSPYECLLGYVHLPRLIDKARLHRQGMLVDYNYKTSGFDKNLLQFLQLDPDAFEEIVNQTNDDATVADWVQKNARVHSPEQIEAWNKEVIQREPISAEQSARFKFTLKVLGAENRSEIKTYFDLIELDEGRL